MMIHVGSVPARPETPASTAFPEALRARYEAYCAEQAAALPALLPRDGVRELYRSAREVVSGDVVDPLALLVARCRELLPLPPFEVWAADYLRDHRPYHEEVESGTAGPVRSTPVTVDRKRIELAGRSWEAGLTVFRAPPQWRGFITFQAEGGTGGPEAGNPRPPHRTADIFVEARAEDIRDRFHSFSADTLQAFLRSTLP
jgi:hypothetical protein